MPVTTEQSLRFIALISSLPVSAWDDGSAWEKASDPIMLAMMFSERFNGDSLLATKTLAEIYAKSTVKSGVTLAAYLRDEKNRRDWYVPYMDVVPVWADISDESVMEYVFLELTSFFSDINYINNCGLSLDELFHVYMVIQARKKDNVDFFSGIVADAVKLSDDHSKDQMSYMIKHILLSPIIT